MPTVTGGEVEDDAVDERRDRHYGERAYSLPRRDDADDPAPAPDAELDGARCGGEQRVVAATPDVVAGMEMGPALPDDDLACLDDLAAVPLDAQALGVGVAPVPGGRGTLLVSHRSSYFVVAMPVILTWVYFCRWPRRRR